MQYSLDLTSQLTGNAPHRSKRTDNSAAPTDKASGNTQADSSNGATETFSSALQQAMQQKTEQPDVSKRPEAPQSEAPQNEIPHDESASDEAQTALSGQTDAEMAEGISADTSDQLQPAKSDLSKELTATLQAILSGAITPAIPQPATSIPIAESTPAPEAIEGLASSTTQPTPILANPIASQPNAPINTQVDGMPAPTFNLPEAPKAINSPMTNQTNIDNLTSGQAAPIAGMAVEQPTSLDTTATSDLTGTIDNASTATTGATIDSTLIPLTTESLPLPQLELPAKGLKNGTNVSSAMPLPVTGAKGEAIQPVSETVTPIKPEHLDALKGIQDQLQSLNGEIERLNSDTTDSSDELSSIDAATTASQPELPQTPALESLTTAQPVIHTTPDKPGNPVAQFVSSAQHPTDQVIDGTLYSVKNGHKELIIRLNPDNLGEVRINLISHGNQELSARLIASTQESHELLKSQVESLKQTLESQGVQVDRLSVVLAGSPESARDFSQNSQQSQQHPSHSQQDTQQSFNQQGQPNPNLFNQMGGQFQQKSGFAHRPGGAQSVAAIGDSTPITDGTGGKNNTNPVSDNGRISILA